MFYLIDYDTREVQCKSENKPELLDYIETNDLSMAVVLIDSRDELCLKLSIREAAELYEGMVGVSIKYNSEDDIMRKAWDAVQSRHDTIPDYSRAVGNKMLKQAVARSRGDSTGSSGGTSERSKKNTSRKPKDPVGSPKKQTVTKSGNPTLGLADTPKVGTVLGAMYKIVEDNLGEMTFNELVDEYLLETDCTEKLARRYVNKSIRLNHLKVI